MLRRRVPPPGMQAQQSTTLHVKRTLCHLPLKLTSSLAGAAAAAAASLPIAGSLNCGSFKRCHGAAAGLVAVGAAFAACQGCISCLEGSVLVDGVASAFCCNH
jgi:hypothetical protein